MDIHKQKCIGRVIGLRTISSAVSQGDKEPTRLRGLLILARATSSRPTIDRSKGIVLAKRKVCNRRPNMAEKIFRLVSLEQNYSLSR
jgi:hypothetical protein